MDLKKFSIAILIGTAILGILSGIAKFLVGG
jgi:hypothetical protein